MFLYVFVCVLFTDLIYPFVPLISRENQLIMFTFELIMFLVYEKLIVRIAR
jgi:hypothetical protein